MTTASRFFTALNAATLGTLVGLTLVPDEPGWAAEPRVSESAAAQPSPATLSTQKTALDALAQAHRAAQRRDAQSAFDQIERAETALLNLEQTRHDPRLEQALLRLDLARTAITHKDMKVADEQLGAVGHGLTGAFAVAAAPDDWPVGEGIRPDQIRASQMLGEPVYNVDDHKVGNVIDIVLDKDGTIDAIVIGIPGASGAGVKNVAVPITELKSDNSHRTLDRTPDQLQQATNYQLDGGNPVMTTGSGATKPPEDDPAYKYRPGRRQ
jgi:sporulation protein YlmC with PRC-barrel domain